MATIEYLVTTRAESIPANRQIIMVDGTVPGWLAKSGDLHFDHHRPGGAPVQISEIPWTVMVEVENSAVIVTTQVDADACVAAAWVQLADVITEPILRKLRAIAWDCDHLYCPKDLSDLSDFAAQCVAALKSDSDALVKELKLPTDRKAWSIEQKEKYASLAFERGTKALIDACQGKRKFPGENGEAAGYWKQVEENTAMLEREGRVTSYKGATIIEMKGLAGKYIDPRCPLRIVQKGQLPKTPVTVSRREVFINNEFKGFSYTLGVVPWHPSTESIDYTKGVFEALSAAERKLNPSADGWGGRKTVGGSGWNSPSNLEPKQVIDIVLSALSK